MLTLIREEAGTTTATWGGAYNADDWLTLQNDGAGLVAYGYDQAGRLRFETAPGITGSVWTAVDAAGRATAISDTLAGLPSQQTGFTYYGTNRPQTMTVPLSTTGHTLVEGRQYDQDNRLSCLTALGPGQDQVVSPLHLGFTYTYSAQSVITGVTAEAGAAACSSSQYAPAQVMGYDAAGRLVATNGQTWGYDGNGNLLTTVLTTTGPVTTVYNYANPDGSEPAGWLPNEILRTTFGISTGQLLQSFAYDGVGDVTAITTTDPRQGPTRVSQLAYNAQGLLSALTTTVAESPPSTITMQIAYNAFGQRARVSVSDTHPTYGGAASFTEVLHYRGRSSQVSQVAVLEGTTSFTETFVYRRDGTPLELVYQKVGQAAQRYHYVVDGQGNVVGLTNDIGSVVDPVGSQYSYDPWGGRAIPAQPINETVPQPLRYRGYWYDGWYDGAGDYNGTSQYLSDDTRPAGWYWLGVRAYDPLLERFLQPDPSAQDGVRSYAYAHDDPVNQADPSGLAGGRPEPGPGQLPLPFEEPPSVGVVPAGADTEYVQQRLQVIEPGTVDPSSQTEFATAETSASNGSAATPASPSVRDLYQQALQAEQQLENAPSGNPVVASDPDGTYTTSGNWGVKPIRGFVRRIGRSLLGDKALARLVRNGEELVDAGSNDQGILGRWESFHAERQLFELNPGRPIAVKGRLLCILCIRYFQIGAAEENVTQAVLDANTLHVFLPDGTYVPISRATFND